MLVYILYHQLIHHNNVYDLDQVLYNGIEYHFIELKKFHKKSKELETLADKWIYFIKNAENLEVIPDNIEDEGLRTAYEDASKFNWTKAELAAYDYAFMRQQDEKGKWELATRRAVEEAVQENVKNKEYEIAENAILEGFSNELIVKLTGLTIEEIETLRIKNK